MSDTTFRALWITEDEAGHFHREIAERKISDLPEGEVLIKVQYAGLNYKDALSASGNKGVTRRYPHTPGIDAAGLVAESSHSDFKEGDAVVVTGYDLGMNTAGGFGEYIRVPAAWVVSLPQTLSLRESMIIGTGGVTAGIGLYKMEKMGQKPSDGPLIVTGATGGVGSMAVGMYAQAGYNVIASTGSAKAKDFLMQLGASEVVDRAFVNDDSRRPLMKPKWAGGIDNVGGNTLATLLKACKPGGSIANCGLVESAKLDTTIFPFILNGVNLLGINSATFPMPERLEVWQKLTTTWRIPNMDRLTTDCSLEELNSYIDKMLQGQTQGRVVVNM